MNSPRNHSLIGYHTSMFVLTYSNYQRGPLTTLQNKYVENANKGEKKK